jgi:glycosyltransferase involved in cell wall biosynthesis
MSYLKRIIAFFKFSLGACRKAASFDADVIFATSTPLTIIIPAYYTKLIRRIPIVFEVRDLWPELPIAMGALRSPVTRKLARWMEIFAYRNSKAIVALSPGIKEGVVKAGISSKVIAIIPNGCDRAPFSFNKTSVLEFYSSRPWLEKRPFLLYAGTFGKINGVDYFIDLAIALDKLQSNLLILLIGNGAEFELVQSKARKVGVFNKNLFIENSLPKKEITTAFNAASVCSSVFIDEPAMRANSSNKFFDSLAAGKPVFINYGGWMHDLIGARGVGFSAWQTPIDETATILNQKINDRDWLLRAGKKAEKLAIEYFDREILAEQLMKVLEIAVNETVVDVEIVAPGEYDAY